ncbi:hypothetical protein LXL04_018105 [Taraxacum kok-saghyz]
MPFVSLLFGHLENCNSNCPVLSKGWDTIWMVVGRLTKYPHFVPLKHPFTAATVADNFIKEIVRLHGFPLAIISDRDRIFLSHFWSELFKVHGVHLKRSTAYHPQSDGQSEVQWAQWLPWAEFWYNSSYHTSTKCSPFRALYGRNPPPIVRYEGQQSPVDAVDRLLEDRDAILDELRMHLLRAQQKMQAQANKKRKEVEFTEGDLVYLKLKPFRQHSVAMRKFQKLAARFYGPFKIIKRIGKVAYTLELPPTSRIHPTFHVSQLRKTHGAEDIPVQLPPQLTEELELQICPAEIKGVRPKHNSTTGEREILIEWEGLSPTEATWEELDIMLKLFPNHHLEDKVKVWMAGIDKPPIIHVYKRRSKGKQGSLGRVSGSGSNSPGKRIKSNNLRMHKIVIPTELESPVLSKGCEYESLKAYQCPYTLRKGFGFHCHSCKFYLDLECALMMPRMIRHKHDKHPLILRYEPVDNHPGDYFCDICEYEFDPINSWFYHCGICVESMHPSCAPVILRCDQVVHARYMRRIFRYINVKFGGTLEIEWHPYPMRFVQGTSCHGICEECGGRLWYEMIFECLECDYAIHYECANDLVSASDSDSKDQINEK